MKVMPLILIGIFLTINVYGSNLGHVELIGPVEDVKIREYVRREIGYTNDGSAEYGSIGPVEENKIRAIIRHKLGYISSPAVSEYGSIGPVEEKKIESIIMNELNRYELPKSIEQMTKENIQLKKDNLNLEKRVSALEVLTGKQVQIIELFKMIFNKLKLL